MSSPSHSSLQDPTTPCLIDLDDRPHTIAAKGTRFGITAVCAVNSSSSSSRPRFVSGGCGGADKSICVWSLPSKWRAKPRADIVRLPTHHTSTVHALAYIPFNNYIVSGGKDSRLVLTDLAAEQVVQSNVVHGNEPYQLHVADTDGPHNVVLCEVQLNSPPFFTKDLLNSLSLLPQMKRATEILLFDIRGPMKVVGRLIPKTDADEISPEESLEKTSRTRFTRGYFAGDWFVRGMEIFDLRQTKQTASLPI